MLTPHTASRSSFGTLLYKVPRCACICAQLIVLTGARCWVQRMMSKLHVRPPVRPATSISCRCARVHTCACICAFSYICKVYMPEILAHVAVRVFLWVGACMRMCMCIPAHRWPGAGLRCLQCISNEDAVVLRRAIDLGTHVCAYTKKQYQATIQDISLNCYMH